MTVGNAEQTTIESYNLVYTGTGAGGEPATFPLGVTSGDMNLLLPSHGGVGKETGSNRLCMLFLADQAGSGTIVITGACQGGPEEYIASLALLFDDVVETGTNIWCETAVLTSYHLGACSTLIADSGNDRPVKFGFDAIGYQYIKFYTKDFVTTTWIMVYVRYF